jgi:predicted transcriptional regulator
MRRSGPGGDVAAGTPTSPPRDRDIDRFKREAEEMCPPGGTGRSRSLLGGINHANAQVTVGERDRLDQRTRRHVKAAQQGVDLDDSQPVLNVGSYADLSRLRSQQNLELLETIFKCELECIREIAELVDRDYKQVHRNLSELEDIGVIGFEGAASGRAKKLVLAYVDLEIDIPFAGSEDSLGTATP